jgi:hypothetical protein
MSIKLWGVVLAALAAGGISGTAGAASPPQTLAGPSSYLELYGSWAQVGGTYSYYSPFGGAGFAGRANFWVNPLWSLQVDLSGNTVWSGYSDEGSMNNGLVGVHISRRDPGKGLIGVFAGIAGTNDYYADLGVDGNLFGGVEAQAYLGNLTLYGQVGYIGQFSGYYGPSTDETHNNWFAQLDARYFVSPNTKIEGKIGYINGPIWGGGGDYVANGLTFGAEIEHQLKALPFSVFARFSGLSDANYTTRPIHQYAAAVGIRIRFGDTDTLQARDRNGATLAVYDFDPIGWYRWND